MKRVRTMCVLLAVVGAPAIAEAHHHHHCEETSEVVGQSTCRQFGSSWAMPWWAPSFGLELGMLGRTLRAPTIEQLQFRSAESASTVHNDRLDAVGSELRLSVDLTRWLYIASVADGMETSRADVVFDFGGAVGARVPLGRTSIDLELDSGQRSLFMGRRSNPLPNQALFESKSEQWYLDTRVRVERWLNPWMSAGVWLGQSLRARDDMSAGVMINMWSRSFRRR